MLRVDYGAEPLLDPRAGVFLSEAAFCWKAGQAGRFSAVLPPGHPLAGRVRVMDAASEVALSEGGRVTWQGRLTSIERRFDGSVAVEGEDALAYLNDTVVPPYANYAAPDYKGEPNAPRDAGELFAWLVERHNERAFLDSKRFCPGRSMAGRELLRSSTVWPTSASEIKSKLLATGGVLAVRYEAGEKVLDWLDDGAGEGGQEIEFGRNLLDFAREESAADVVNGIVPVSKHGDGGRFGLDGWGGSTRGDYVVAGGMVFDQAQASVQGVIAEKREYEASTPEKLVEMAMSDLDSAKLAVSSIEVSAVDLSAIDPSVPPIRYLDWVTVSSRPHGFRASMLCVERRLDALDPSKTRYVFGASRRTLTGGQVRTEQYIRSAVAPAVEAVPALSEAARAAAETAEEASASAAAAKSDAAVSAERAGRAVEDAETAIDEARKVEGRPGVSPIVSFERKGAETVISVKDAEGVKKTSVPDGRDADPATVERIETRAGAAEDAAVAAAEEAERARKAASAAEESAGAMRLLVRETPQGVEVGASDGSGAFPKGRTRQSGDAFEVLGPDGSAIARLAKDVLELIGGRMSISAEPYDDGPQGWKVMTSVRSNLMSLLGGDGLKVGASANSIMEFGRYGGWRIVSAALPEGGGAKLMHDENLNCIKAVVEHGGRKTTLTVANNGVWIDGNPVERRKVLYDGSRATGAVTLKESAANFSRMEIHYSNNDGEFASTSVWRPNGKKVCLSTTTVTADGGMGWAKSKQVTVNGSRIYNTGRAGESSIGPHSGGTVYDNCIGITAVIGFV